MNSKNTWLWVALAAGVFAFIFFFERHIRKPETGPPRVFPHLQAGDIRSVQVQIRGQRAIQVQRTNDTWRMTEPLEYPAYAERIEALLTALQHLTAMPYLSPEDLKAISEPDVRFGFDAPPFSLLLNHKQHLVLIGRRTPPGDQVYLQLVGVDGVFVVDAGLLKLLPQSVSDWRDTRLVDWPAVAFDRMMVTNAGKVLDLQLVPAKNLWRMLSPNDARADSGRVTASLKQLATLEVQQFITDEPNADLESMGLQPPELSLVFLRETNTTLQLDFGKSPTNQPHLVYARRAGEHTIVAVSNSIAEPWSSSHSHDFRDFLDPRLVALPRLPDLIEVRGAETFSLERTVNDSWRVDPPGYPADTILMGQLFVNLTNLQVTAEQIEKDIVPAADLPKYGLAQPYRQYLLRAAATPETGGTNPILSQLEFGTNQNKLYARVAGEGFVYSMDPGVLNFLPSAAWQMRDRRVWNFKVDEVQSLTIHQGTKTRHLVRKGVKTWALASGSQGIMDEILSAQIEETMHRLGDLTATFWVQYGGANLDAYGFRETAYRLVIELNSGDKLSVEFGRDAPSNFPYAVTKLEGEPWVFEFPWTIYQFVQMYLQIPGSVP
jgi:hypothetical protein